ncbi:zonular occludens toxin domain-containing protein [Vreelandella gomseomensis]|uniref:Zonular occludens toxin domain-containing protein n=1 Tax=Vreelandella gomseomensis TaxID=370766 RepID=A0ABU1GEP4_9GAMM|nr:zonular occludens toxin domain-containing protein [Halomonas gomseomensis]MDR5875509.1 zonular occludens toxin domain-containing protein [Halomonas gomseomensis]
MAVYVVTGKLGAGKTLVAVGKIKDKLVQGCKVATNLDLNLDQLIGEKAKQTRCYRIPDKPVLADLKAIGTGTDDYDENTNGLLVLDECGTWFNARSWNDKSRQDVINWFLHARKLGWDIIFLIQDVTIMDKQARLALAEHVVYCRRLDRVTVPFVGALYSLFMGKKMPLPKVHLGIVKYGDSPQSLTVERWTYTGRALYPAYDTKQAFSDHYPHGTYSVLPPWYTHGMFRVPRDARFYMKMTRIYWKRFNRPFLSLASFALGVFLTVSVLVADRVDARSQDDTPPPALPDLSNTRIASFTQLGEQITYRLIDSDQQSLTTDDLARQGFRIVPVSACLVRVENGVSHAEIRC